MMVISRVTRDAGINVESFIYFTLGMLPESDVESGKDHKDECYQSDHLFAHSEHALVKIKSLWVHLGPRETD